MMPTQGPYLPCGRGCTGDLLSLWVPCWVYENPVRDLHGLCLYVPYGTYTRRIVSGFDL
ncbi:unnamed protein product [Ascophyllum nodosum]